MKMLLSIIGYCFFGLGFSQKWINVDQPDINVKYKLPSEWEVDDFGFGFSEWDDGGSLVCNCAGTINSNYDDSFWMVIYPTDSKSNLLKREYVWDFHFVKSTSVQTVNSKRISFQRVISKWEVSNEYSLGDPMLNDMVWQLTAKTENYGLVIYFWGDASVMLANEKTIYKILDSMVQVKK